MIDARTAVEATGFRAFMERVLSSATSSRILVALIVVLYGSGFINLLPTGSVYIATVLIDVTCIGLGVLLVARLVTTRWPSAAWIWALVGLLVVYGLLLFHGGESWYTRLTTVRNDLLYAVVGVYAAVMLKSVEDVSRVMRAIRVAGGLFAVFGIVQFLFRNWLPEWLLVTRDTPAFSYYGTDIVRSTGLLGNTIIYANLMVLFVAVFGLRFAMRTNWRDLVGALAATGAVIVTFSRLAIVAAVAMLVISAVVWVTRNRSRRVFWVLAGVVGGVIVIVGLLLALPPTRSRILDSFLVRGLFLGENASVQGSTDRHGSFSDTAAAVLGSAERWIGFGIGTQSQRSVYAEHHKVITDGALLSTLAEGGILLLIAYGVVLVIACVALVRACRVLEGPSRALAVAMCAYSVYLFAVAALFNSAYFGKVLFITYWMLFGVVMAMVAVARAQRPVARA